MRDAVAGDNTRQSSQLELAAWAVSHLLQPYAKKGQHITPAKLLGRGFYTQQAKEAAWKQGIEPKLNKGKMN